MRDSFIFYRSFYEAIRDLPRDIQGEIYTAIMEYGLYGKETENLKPVARSIFTLIKPQIDVNNKRFENGSKGGRPPKKETKEKPNNNQKETKEKPNNNVNVNENEKEISLSGDQERSSPPPDIFELPLQDCYQQLAGNASWAEQLVMGKRYAGHRDFMPEDFHRYLKLFFHKLSSEGVTAKIPKDAKSHFSRWLDIELKNRKDGSTGNYSPGEELTADGKRKGVLYV